ncbi:hypothetical protein R3P38DRAFT_3574850 [Favolaschia claudopus]|uniref:Uncharacterized protein n=1 Tax=Favolaschia claudopus TaxID=2862362 RepID=A0AAW0AM96_9AGAR
MSKNGRRQRTRLQLSHRLSPPHLIMTRRRGRHETRCTCSLPYDTAEDKKAAKVRGAQPEGRRGRRMEAEAGSGVDRMSKIVQRMVGRAIYIHIYGAPASASAAESSWLSKDIPTSLHRLVKCYERRAALRSICERGKAAEAESVDKGYTTSKSASAILGRTTTIDSILHKSIRSVYSPSHPVSSPKHPKSPPRRWTLHPTLTPKIWVTSLRNPPDGRDAWGIDHRDPPVPVHLTRHPIRARAVKVDAVDRGTSYTLQRPAIEVESRDVSRGQSVDVS